MVIARLGVRGDTTSLRENWRATRGSAPRGEILFLTPRYLAWVFDTINQREPGRERCEAMRRGVVEDPALRALAWHCYRRYFDQEAPREEIVAWPWDIEALGEDAALFYRLIFFAGLERLVALFRARGLPEEVQRDTLEGLAGRGAPDRGKRSTVGPHILRSLAHGASYWRRGGFRAGRLRYIPGRAPPYVRVFRRDADGAVVALSLEDLRFRPDGMRAEREETDAWTSSYEALDAAFAGFPISPQGRALRETVALDRPAWRLALSPGDPILDIHIPGDAPLDVDACGASLRRAAEVARRCYPEKGFFGFTCGSWLLDPLFERFLPETSNLIRFQRELYLYPILARNAGLKWIFGESFATPEAVREAEDLPRESRLQRAVAERLGQGGCLFSAGCFLLADDLDQWGRQVYRRRPKPWER